MKSLRHDVGEGVWELMPESTDDLWLLSTIILPGDRCTALTQRKLQIGEGVATRKMMVITIEVEKVALEGSQLRILGVVREGPEDVPHGDHHSLLIAAQSKLTLVKTHWSLEHTQRVREACESKPPSVLLVAFDREEATLAALRRSGYEVLLRLSGQVQKKRMTQKVNIEFFDELAAAVKDADERHKPLSIVSGSPAFWKDALLQRVDARLRKKIIIATCSGGHERAIDELLRRDEVRESLRGQRAVREARLVDDVMDAIGKGGAVVYGVADVENAALAGAVATLLVSESLLRRAREELFYERIDGVLRAVDAAKGEIVIIGPHDAGKRLDGLGGIAALLRYRLS